MEFPQDERFFSPNGKNLLPCGKFNDIDAKQTRICDFHHAELAKDKLFILCWKIYRTVRDFYRAARKISRRAGTCPGNAPSYVVLLLFHEIIPLNGCVFSALCPVLQPSFS
jgi:hypothetical protein